MELLCDRVEGTLAAYCNELVTRSEDNIDDQIARFSLLFNLCLWFHDCIYDPRSQDNELQSVVVFEEFAEAVDLNGDDRMLVTQVIKDTISHKRTSGLDDNQVYLDLSAYFLDADLSILCADDSTYDDYAERIWREYEFVGR